jgi:hypothetical protein
MVVDVTPLGPVWCERSPSDSAAVVPSCEPRGSMLVPYGTASRTFERSR